MYHFPSPYLTYNESHKLQTSKTLQSDAFRSRISSVESQKVINSYTLTRGKGNAEYVTHRWEINKQAPLEKRRELLDFNYSKITFRCFWLEVLRLSLLIVGPYWIKHSIPCHLLRVWVKVCLFPVGFRVVTDIMTNTKNPLLLVI